MIRRLLLVLPSAALLLCATPGVLGATTTASAGASTLYAYAAGGATSPTSCPPDQHYLPAVHAGSCTVTGRGR